ncbi:MAG: peptide chain release factor N(5)-glutamine methyltransferase [Alphaproteobacteria bacterium]|nr:peptide chain release factor N(5)-glutamine methyltransferase [Alphaproteobacteria bacterium]
MTAPQAPSPEAFSPEAPLTVAAALAEAARRLAGLPDARREARLLLALVLDTEPLSLLMTPERPLPDGAAARLTALLARRAGGEPASRIAGRRGFWSLDLAISPAVLDPRPETELLVERVLAHLAPRRTQPLRLLDLGTGSGCILLALLSELPNALGLGIDRSPAALAVARANAEAAGLAPRTLWACGAWAAALDQHVDRRFDAVVSNPPYIPSGALATLDRSVRAHDPMLALDGGPDGLAAYRRIVPALPGLVKPGGIACLEVGRGQAGAVADLGRRAGLEAAIHDDLAGIPRAVSLFVEI